MNIETEISEILRYIPEAKIFILEHILDYGRSVKYNRTYPGEKVRHITNQTIQQE